MRTLVTLSLVVLAAGCANSRDLRGRYPSSGSSSASGAPVESYGSAPTTTIYSGTASGRPDPARSSPSLAPAAPPRTGAAAPQAHPETSDGPWEVPAEQRGLAKESSTPSSEKAGTTPSAQAKASDQGKPAGEQGKTAADQGNSKSEVAITAAIRRELVRSSTLSFGAKNVKVITSGTQVTLRGEVASDVERAEIERVARAAENVTEVDNRLEVKR